MLGIRSLRNFYFLMFYFWFRLDLFTKRREDKALKALGAVIIVQVWVLLGGCIWGEILLGLPSPRVEVFLGTVAVLFVGNYAVLRRRGWEEFEKRFARYSDRSRTWQMAMAGAVSVAALALLLSAVIVSRHDR